MDVGALTELVTVDSRVSELQVESGERSFSLESQAIQNIASNGRQLFNYALLVPGVVSIDNNAGNERNQASSFTVNGQRETSNNVTIDGVANIDTGDNGGNMATTNTEAIGEFKVLTNSYQAEYGRAVGGQIQMVTKSGTQQFHGSGYWFGRRSGWNANSWTQQPGRCGGAHRQRQGDRTTESSRDDYGYTLGGPLYIPGVFNQDKKKLFFFWAQEFENRSNPPALKNGARAYRSWSVRATSRRASTPAAPCSPTSATTRPACPWPERHEWLLRGRRRARQDPGNPDRRARSRGAQHLPHAELHERRRHHPSSQLSNQNSPRQDLIRLDFQPSDQMACHRPLHGHQERHHPGVRHHLGRQRQQQRGPDGGPLQEPRLQLDGVRQRHPQHYDVGRSERRHGPQLARLRAAAARPDPLRGGRASEMPLLYPDAVAADYIPFFQFNGGNTANAAEYRTNQGPFTNQNTTWDILGNLTKIWGQHSAKVGVYYQTSYKPQSIFYPLQQPDQLHRQLEQPL